MWWCGGVPLLVLLLLKKLFKLLLSGDAGAVCVLALALVRVLLAFTLLELVMLGIV